MRTKQVQPDSSQFWTVFSFIFFFFIAFNTSFVHLSWENMIYHLPVISFLFFLPLQLSSRPTLRGCRWQPHSNSQVYWTAQAFCIFLLSGKHRVSTWMNMAELSEGWMVKEAQSVLHRKGNCSLIPLACRAVSNSVRDSGECKTEFHSSRLKWRQMHSVLSYARPQKRKKILALCNTKPRETSIKLVNHLTDNPKTWRRKPMNGSCIMPCACKQTVQSIACKRRCSMF